MFTSQRVGESLGCSVRLLGKRVGREARMGRGRDLDGCNQDLEGLKG